MGAIRDDGVQPRPTGPDIVEYDIDDGCHMMRRTPKGRKIQQYGKRRMRASMMTVGSWLVDAWGYVRAGMGKARSGAERG